MGIATRASAYTKFFTSHQWSYFGTRIMLEIKLGSHSCRLTTLCRQPISQSQATFSRNQSFATGAPLNGACVKGVGSTTSNTNGCWCMTSITLPTTKHSLRWARYWKSRGHAFSGAAGKVLSCNFRYHRYSSSSVLLLSHTPRFCRNVTHPFCLVATCCCHSPVGTLSDVGPT